MISIFTVLIPGIVLGIFFIIIDNISGLKPIQEIEKKHRDIYISSVAGISIAFIFLKVIPEIRSDFPDPFLDTYLFLFILIGFIFIHLTEKLILQKVERKSQDKINEFDEIMSVLEKEEKTLEEYIEKEVENGNLDKNSLELLINSDHKIHEKEMEIESEAKKLKLKIFNHIYKDLSFFHAIVDYTTHFLVGMILVNLLFIHVLSATLFFIFTSLKSIISSPLNRHLKITLGDEEFDVNINRGERLWKKIFFMTSVLTGIIIGYFLESLNVIHQFVYDASFAFISGVFFYIIMREVLPEREKGKPLYFLISTVAFSVVIFIINYIELLIF
ncbi:MAG: hypothetical protein ACTSVY_14305 [Candidatus Helarchaeota archaeon]